MAITVVDRLLLFYIYTRLKINFKWPQNAIINFSILCFLYSLVADRYFVSGCLCVVRCGGIVEKLGMGLPRLLKSL